MPRRRSGYDGFNNWNQGFSSGNTFRDVNQQLGAMNQWNNTATHEFQTFTYEQMARAFGVQTQAQQQQYQNIYASVREMEQARQPTTDERRDRNTWPEFLTSVSESDMHWEWAEPEKEHVVKCSPIKRRLPK